MKAGRILLVEDNPGDQALTLRALRKGGIANEVIVVHDGAEALDYLFCAGEHAGRSPAENPALVLLDLNLPKIGGLEVLRRLRGDERTKPLLVVILTSSGEETDLKAGYEAGANSYVRKPVEFNEFATAVQTLGLYWMLINEPPPTP
jgi:two-component system response regulator